MAVSSECRVPGDECRVCKSHRLPTPDLLTPTPGAILGPTMTEPNYNLLRVRQIVLEHLGDHPASVYLYGSRATGNARPTSDVDVAVLPRIPLPPGTLAATRDALSESTVPFTVDLTDLSETDATFRARVLAEGILWKK